jgi:hypothetical protein
LETIAAARGRERLGAETLSCRGSRRLEAPRPLRAAVAALSLSSKRQAEAATCTVLLRDSTSGGAYPTLSERGASGRS